MSTTTVPATPPLTADGELYVKRQLFTTIRELGDRLRDETGHVDVRLDTLVLDVFDELDREQLDRSALFRATLAVVEHTENVHKTAATMHNLAAALTLGWAADNLDDQE